MESHSATDTCNMKFLLVLAAFLALSSASHLFAGKQSVQGEGLYDKYRGLGGLYGQQKGYGQYAPSFQGRQNIYDYYGSGDYYNQGPYYGNKDYYYGNKDYYYGNKDYYYGNKDQYYGNKDYYYGNKDYSYGNKDYSYGNKGYYYNDIDTTSYPFFNQVARQGLYNQYENIIPYNYEYFNQIPSVYQHLYKGYYPQQQYTYGKGYGYGYGLNYPFTYQYQQYGRQYEPVAPRQLAY